MQTMLYEIFHLSEYYAKVFMHYGNFAVYVCSNVQAGDPTYGGGTIAGKEYGRRGGKENLVGRAG